MHMRAFRIWCKGGEFIGDGAYSVKTTQLRRFCLVKSLIRDFEHRCPVRPTWCAFRGANTYSHLERALTRCNPCLLDNTTQTLRYRSCLLSSGFRQHNSKLFPSESAADILLCCGQHAWVLASLHPSNTVVKAERPPTPKRARLFGRHNSSRGATFVAMMQTNDLTERNNLAVSHYVREPWLRAS
jgi:hypothetical protein